MQVSKWGDSLAVRLPKALVEKMGLSAGDELNIVDVVERTLIVQKEDRRKAALEDMQHGRAFGGLAIVNPFLESAS
jgi:antitoxin MazE